MIYRLVYEQNGHESESSVVLAESEVSEHLKLEASMHLFGGWKATLFGEADDGYGPDDFRREPPDLLFGDGKVTSVVLTRGNVVRRVWARAFDPATDGEERS